MLRSDGERMEVAITLPQDFPYQDLLSIGTMLREAQLLVPGFVPSEFGVYRPDGYLLERSLYDTDFYFLPDRNLTSRIVQVAKGRPVDEKCRIAAGLMAFAQCLNINFEPSIAFHELAHLQGNAAAQEELRWFRAADKARPLNWIDIATGRAENMKSISPAPAGNDFDLAKPLRRWNRNYIILLKICELELEKGPAIQKALRLLDWMFSEFILGGPAFLFASLYFAPSVPRRRLLKSLRSPDRERAVGGVRNAAWDLTHISDFIRRTQEGSGGERFILASADKGLQRVAASLVSRVDEPDDVALAVAARLVAWWPSQQAKRIADSYAGRLRDMNDVGRNVNMSTPPVDYISTLIVKGEQSLRAWKA